MADLIVLRKENDDVRGLDGSDWFRILEIFNVEIRRLGEKREAEIYGKIELDYPYGIWDLYNRDKDNAETISLPGAITLNHPRIAVQAFDNSYISFALKGGFEELRDETDFVSWDPDYGTLNKLMIEEFKGQNCALAVSYIVHQRALVADLELLLLGHNGAKIYGNATASFTKVGHNFEMAATFYSSCIPYTDVQGMKCVLFSKDRKDCVSVCEDEFKIPLCKSVICIPFELALDIQVNLFRSSGVKIVSRVVRCFPKSCGEYVGIIRGKKGKVIQVKVTVWSYPEHLPTTKDRQLYRSGLKPCY